MTVEEELREKARELGIPMVGFSPVEKTSYGEIVRSRLAKGYIPPELATNTECFRVPEIYADARNSLAEGKTLVCVGQPYLEHIEFPKDMSLRAAIARHYWRDTYTDLYAKRDALIEALRAMGLKAERAKVHPREAARLTGLGWIGKNSFVINPAYGTWALYYAFVTDTAIEPSARIDKRCPEKCTKCLDACPTRALVEPYVLNAGRCVNFILENTGPMPEWARELVGNRINGCDACQEACPMNKKAKAAPEPMTGRIPDRGLVPYPLLERCFAVTPEEMKANYEYMDWYESSIRYLRRNALVALGNSGEKALACVAEKYAGSGDELLRGHAQWALARLRGRADAGCEREI